MKHIINLVSNFKVIYERAIVEYTPLVTSLIRNRSQNKQEIEWLLDGLLDFADNDRILKLYRKLCRYYYFIDPVATSYYVNAYREMWDSDGELYNSGYFKANKIE